MEDKAEYKTKTPTQPGQGRKREQYEFAATMIAACLSGIFMIAVAIMVIKALKLIF